MTAGQAVMALFTGDGVVLRPSEIVFRTGRNSEAVRKAVRRLVARGQLFNIAHAQYARCSSARPIGSHRDRIADLELRIAELETQVTRIRDYLDWKP